jgi:hypothetical protein
MRGSRNGVSHLQAMAGQSFNVGTGIEALRIRYIVNTSHRYIPGQVILIPVTPFVICLWYLPLELRKGHIIALHLPVTKALVHLLRCSLLCLRCWVPYGTVG